MQRLDAVHAEDSLKCKISALRLINVVTKKKVNKFYTVYSLDCYTSDLHLTLLCIQYLVAPSALLLLDTITQ